MNFAPPNRKTLVTSLTFYLIKGCCIATGAELTSPVSILFLKSMYVARLDDVGLRYKPLIHSPPLVLDSSKVVLYEYLF